MFQVPIRSEHALESRQRSLGQADRLYGDPVRPRPFGRAGTPAPPSMNKSLMVKTTFSFLAMLISSALPAAPVAAAPGAPWPGRPTVQARRTRAADRTRTAESAVTAGPAPPPGKPANPGQPSDPTSRN